MSVKESRCEAAFFVPIRIDRRIIYPFIKEYNTPEISNGAGIVSNHAHKMLFAVPQLIDLTPLVKPTPMIEPTMLCEVLTGMPKTEHVITVAAPAVSAQNPLSGVIFTIPLPVVLITFLPPTKVPNAIIK